MLECGERLRRWTTKRLNTCIPSIFPLTKSATPRNPPEERRRQLAVALLRWEAKSKIDTPPFLSGRRSSGWRRWLCSDSWYRASADRCWSSWNWSSCGESGSESSSAAEVSGFSMARKRNEQETNWWVKWQRSSRHHACATKMFPPKPLPQRVSFWMRTMTCWAVPWRIDKGPIAKKKCTKRAWKLPESTGIIATSKLQPINKLEKLLNAIQLKIAFKTPYYRKRGGASYFVREVRSVRKRETERDRRKWRHLSSAEISDEFCTFPCQNFAPWYWRRVLHFSSPKICT